MKRLAALLATTILLGAVLSGCGGKSSSQAGGGGSVSGEAQAGPVTITYWTPLTGGDGDFMKAMVDKFNSSQDKVKVEINTSVWENYYAKIAAAMGAGEAPDVAIIHRTWLPNFISKNALYELNDLVQKVGLDGADFVETAWKATEFDGKRYAVPLDVHPLIMFYNMDLLQKAGVVKDGKPPEIKSKDDLVALGKVIQEKTGKYPISVQSAGWTSYREWFTYLYQNGGQLLSDDGKKAAFNSPAGLEALRFQVQLLNELKFSPPGLTTDSMRATWYAGDLAMQGNGVWNTGAFEKKGLNFLTTPYPTLFQKPAVWVNSHTLALPKNKNSSPEKREAALAFIKWLSDNSVMWAQAGQIPVRKSVLESSDFKSLKHQATYANNLEAVVYPPAHVKIGEIENAIWEELQGAYTAKKTPEQALQDAEAKVNAILAGA